MTPMFVGVCRTVWHFIGRCAASVLALALVQVNAQALETSQPPALAFATIFKSPIGPMGPEFSPAAMSANGQRVRMSGFMVRSETPAPGQFLLSPRPVQLSEDGDGQANDLPASTVLVVLDEAQKNHWVPHVSGRLSVDGVLNVGRQEAEDGSVSWLRLLLTQDIPLGH